MAPFSLWTSLNLNYHRLALTSLIVCSSTTNWARRTLTTTGSLVPLLRVAALQFATTNARTVSIAPFLVVVARLSLHALTSTCSFVPLVIFTACNLTIALAFARTGIPNLWSLTIFWLMANTRTWRNIPFFTWRTYCWIFALTPTFCRVPLLTYGTLCMAYTKTGALLSMPVVIYWARKNIGTLTLTWRWTPLSQGWTVNRV